MKKFVVIYHAPKEAAEKMANVSSEEAKKGMEPWMAWAKKIGDRMVDFGTPLGNGMSVTKSGTSPSNKEVNGYTIFQAENMDEAVEMLKGHPHLEWTEGCSIEVHEALPVPGM